MAKYMALLLIIIFGIVLRVWNINNLPPALYSDEVDIGYQAKTFNTNQTDYFGNLFPVHFHSFSDWQPGIGIYLVSLSQKLTNNHELSVRLPSAIFGIVSIIVIYLITKSVIPSFLFAISPWFIHFSRIGFAASGLILALLLGIYFWQKYFSSQKTIYLYLSIIFFTLSPYIYSTAKLFLIFILPLLFIIWRNKLSAIPKKDLFLPLFLGFILLIPLSIDTIQGKSGFRFSYISIFTEPHREQVTDTMRYQDVLIDQPNQIGITPSPVSKLFHNKYQLVINKFINNYLSSFSVEFLILKGDSNSRHGFGNFGLIYIVDLFFIFVGLFSLFSIHPKNKLSLLFFWLLILGPIPFALTRDSNSPNATRLILVLPSLIYFTYIGIKYLTARKVIFLPLIILMYLFSFLNFWHYYRYHYPHESASAWNYGIKESILITNNYPNKNLVFSNFYQSALPFFLFYHPYQLTGHDSIIPHISQIDNQSFAGQSLDNKYYFGHLNWDNLSSLPPNTLIIVPETENNQIPKNLKMIDQTNKPYLMGQKFYIYSLDEK